MNHSRSLKLSGSQCTAVGAGLVALDIVFNGSHVPRLMPGGSCANVLSYLSFLGLKTHLLAHLGSNLASRMVRQRLEQIGVQYNGPPQCSNGNPAVVVEYVQRRQDGNVKHSFRFECPLCKKRYPRRKRLTTESVRAYLERLTAVPSVFYFDRLSPATLLLAETFYNQGSLVVFEPPRTYRSGLVARALKHCHVLKYSEEQIPLPSRYSNSAGPLLEVVTLSADGLKYRIRHQDVEDVWTHVPATRPPLIRDTAGAGDCTTAGLIYLLLEALSNGHTTLESLGHEEVLKICRQAQAMAAVKCMFEGAQGPLEALSPDEFRNIAERLLSGKAVTVPEQAPPDEGNVDVLQELCPHC